MVLVMADVIQYIDINEFMEHLKANNLVVADAGLFEEGKQLRLREMQRKYMRRTAIKYGEALEAQLLPVTSKTSIDRMVADGKLKKGETYKTKTGIKMIMTAAIRRLGYSD